MRLELLALVFWLCLVFSSLFDHSETRKDLFGFLKKTFKKSRLLPPTPLKYFTNTYSRPFTDGPCLTVLVLACTSVDLCQ